MKYLILFLFQLSYMASAFAADEEGYITRTNGDTVWGKVDVQMKKKAMFNKKELDLGYMDQVIYFTENGKRSEKIAAADVSGYGFKYDDVWYHFVVLDFSKNTWKKSIPGFGKKVREGSIFIHRAMDGPAPLYKHFDIVTSTTVSASGTTKSESTVTELYIMSTDIGYVEVAPPNFGANKKLKEFLIKYLNLEEAFLKMMDDKAKFSDTEEVLRTYNDWKQRNQEVEKTFKTPL